MTFEHAKASDYGASLRLTRLGAQERYAHGVMRAALEAAKLTLGSLASASSRNEKGVAALGLILVATH